LPTVWRSCGTATRLVKVGKLSRVRQEADQSFAFLLRLRRKDIVRSAGDRELLFQGFWKECNFIVKKGKAVSDVIQVNYSLKDVDRRKRETEGILEAVREFNLKKGTILTYDESESFAVEGGKIDVAPVWQWLLE
jgi:hypothetical protein